MKEAVILKDQEHDYIKFNTNSSIGSHHWFQTLMGMVIRMGEFIEHNLEHNNVQTYGKEIKEITIYIAKHQRSINNMQ